jgi:hypothetical protein
MVWLLIKSKPGAGVQRWHKDFALGHKITKTIDVNLFTMKRCDLLGGPDCFFNISDNDEGNKANKQSLQDDNNNSISQNSAHLYHVEAMAKKNCKQQTSAIKAMKQCGKAALEAGAGIGAIVSLKVDNHTHSHAKGLLAIVYKVNERTGGILVCCHHGVINHDGTRGDYWVPYDRYLVVAKADKMVPNQTDLHEVWNLVLNVGYRSMDQKRMLYSKYHEHQTAQ